jgi:hypothetical protein
VWAGTQLLHVAHSKSLWKAGTSSLRGFAGDMTEDVKLKRNSIKAHWKSLHSHANPSADLKKDINNKKTLLGLSVHVRLPHLPPGRCGLRDGRELEPGPGGSQAGRIVIMVCKRVHGE